MEWYCVCWPWLTAKRVEPVVSISWASCCLTGLVLCICKSLQGGQGHQKSSEEEALGIGVAKFFTGRMPFLWPNQQCQRTEGISENSLTASKITFIVFPTIRQSVHYVNHQPVGTHTHICNKQELFHRRYMNIAILMPLSLDSSLQDHGASIEYVLLPLMQFVCSTTKLALFDQNSKNLTSRLAQKL